MKGIKVIVVDDDEKFVADLKSCFSENGVTLVCCNSRDEALIELGKGDCQVVIMEYAFEGFDGFEFLKEIKGKYPQIGVVLLSDKEDTPPYWEVVPIEAAGYYDKTKLKPLHILEMVRRVA